MEETYFKALVHDSNQLEESIMNHVFPGNKTHVCCVWNDLKVCMILSPLVSRFFSVTIYKFCKCMMPSVFKSVQTLNDIQCIPTLSLTNVLASQPHEHRAA